MNFEILISKKDNEKGSGGTSGGNGLPRKPGLEDPSDVDRFAHLSTKMQATDIVTIMQASLHNIRCR